MAVFRDSGHTAGINTDFVSGAIIGAALLLFAAIGGSFMLAFAQRLRGIDTPVDRTQAIALLLNIALLLFAWFRYRALAMQVHVLTAAGRHAQLLASRDQLTGFLNRRGMLEDGAALLVQAACRGKAVALMMLDIDHFKIVNDTHGHATGDALLSCVAAAITEVLPPGTLTGRLGGDEFACALPFDAAYPQVVEGFGERLVSRLAQPFLAEGNHLQVGASIGIARSDVDGESFGTLLRAADMALYVAKRGGRNRLVWFDAGMERALQDRISLERRLRSAIADGEIVPYFEQQIELATGRLAGFEVLARWPQSQGDMIPSDVFIPVAEQTGLIADLSLSIMRRAFIAARDWDPGLTVSINISPLQLRDAWLAQKIIKLLGETGFPAHRLDIEITETALFENLALAQSIVGSLKNQGICLTLDDFGTGYSSLAHLRALPFDRIKIDRSFVSAMDDDPESTAIVEAVARMGSSLSLAVTAEGIETADVEDRLRLLGCALGQGYLYGHPRGIADTHCFLAERRLLCGSTPTDPAHRRLAG